ncbi:MAG: exodeoxyribonuclease VII small subunit [Clostridia bacterium]|nr:exodeoxyribonuclease VII small subunit [Clostridia bacterium]
MNENTEKQINEYDLETAMKRLDAVVERLSRENISLEDSLALYEEGVALVKHCNAKLESVERKINLLRMTQDGEISEAPFDTSAI